MIEIIDNFIPTEYFNQLQSYVTSPYQPWYYQGNIDSSRLLNQRFGKHGFACWLVRYPNTFIDDYTDYIGLVMEMKKVVGCKNILRSRLDMTLHKNGDTAASPHVDFTKPHIATIFYFNNSDGNTVIYNEKYDGEDGSNSTESIRKSGITNKLTIKKRIKPKENRLLIFDGLLIHKGHHPSKHNTRILLNSNFN